jgi:hypothetical protein
MMLHKSIGSLLFVALLLAPATAQANHTSDIDIQTESLRIQIGGDRGIAINSRTLGLDVNPRSLRESIYQRFNFERSQPTVTCRSSSNRSTSTFTQRAGSGSTYSQTSTTTQICQ